MSEPDINHENRFLRYFSIVRPQLWQEPDFQKVAFLLHSALAEKQPTTHWDELTDALAELIPEQREFWLRVQATWNIQFIEGLAHSFENDLTDDEATVIAAGIAVKSEVTDE